MEELLVIVVSVHVMTNRASLGYETRTLFEILNACNASSFYGKVCGNDNPSYLSRTGEYFVSSFPNSTTMVVAHYRTHAESWFGGFSRNQEDDEKVLLDVYRTIRKMNPQYKIYFRYTIGMPQGLTLFAV